MHLWIICTGRNSVASKLYETRRNKYEPRKFANLRYICFIPRTLVLAGFLHCMVTGQVFCSGIYEQGLARLNKPPIKALAQKGGLTVERHDVIYCSGTAKMPQESYFGNIGVSLTVEVLVERNSGKIIAADCNLVNGIARFFIVRLLVGHRLPESFEKIEEILHRTFLSETKKAVITALRKISDKYNNLSDERPGKVVNRRPAP